MNIVFWQNTVSVHQAPMIKAIAQSQVRVLVVTQGAASTMRKSMGWEDEPDYGLAQLVVAPSEDEVRSIVAAQDRSTHHIFSGLDAYPLLAYARQQVEAEPHGQIVISTEPFDNRGLGRFLRKAKYASRMSRIKHVNTVLLIGALARKQYSGMLPQSIRQLSFGYFVRSSEVLNKAIADIDGVVHVMYVGSLTERKRPDLLLDLLLEIPSQSWRLTLVGDGPLLNKLKSAAEAHPKARVDFLGTLRNSEISSVLTEADVLALPSAFDGWGAVVNESLSVGTPVLVSSAAGSSDLIVDDELGTVFDSHSRQAFADALKSVIRAGRVRAEKRIRIQQWADQAISPEAAAQYLHSILQNPESALEPPWRRTADLSSGPNGLEGNLL
ncbi:glycosyltransferase [Frigoribacterium sp. CFBP9039]|uniref:glycosyltransferase family 4 protein n=1 Tax=Frigoribacterium sp. CFBP9029 TaxID=3096541 RepID=UPI002A6B4585|nr:glycosyltransferase [Frigoribacterium sp. CFBP9039]MDY0946746.1 glycosyltransferase [Frigoribacterium sp. CFBP9039]